MQSTEELDSYWTRSISSRKLFVSNIKVGTTSYEVGRTLTQAGCSGIVKVRMGYTAGRYDSETTYAFVKFQTSTQVTIVSSHQQCTIGFGYGACPCIQQVTNT